jgi:type IV pilus assembly protein PilB
MIPFAFSKDNKNVLRVAMENPLDTYAQEDISIITNYQVEPVIATTRSIMLAIDKYYGHSEMKNALNQYAKEKKLEVEINEHEEVEVNSSPIVKLVKEMIDLAVRQRASDIHIEPMEEYIRIRYRIDGVLQKKATYNVSVLPAIIARIKIIGGMDISEKRKPQDGRITQVVDRVEYDIRVSILPTVFGEKVVMRLTAKMALTREKSQLGLKPYELEQFDYILKNPHGILLVTGPTGSGKSTTLYTALSELNTNEVNIITVEDPVEANIDGINQVQVNTKADLTFASALRSILRQDPDIIMIGEIRDTETAAIAVQASITGHLVVSTLHTNSAASSVTRLEDMGIEPYLIADSVIGIIAQRLVRRLCPVCKKPKPANEEEKNFLGIAPDSEAVIYEPCGCPKCDNTGFKGRIGVYEIMKMTPTLRSIISHKQDAETIKEQAMKEGMRTLRMSGSEYVLDGTTSYAEALRISFDS